VAQHSIAQVLEELEMKETTIGVSSIGCSAYIGQYIGIDWVDPTHGRAPSVATAVKRLNPDKLVFTYQGDGDLSAIGAGDVLHAAARGEKIAIILANNAIYGMTGGQMSSQSLVGQTTATTLAGRSASSHGYPIDWCTLLSGFPGVSYVARCAVNTPRNVQLTRRYIKTAFERSLEGGGLAFVEILEMCPSGWRMSSQQAADWISESMESEFPVGVLKDVQAPAPAPSSAGDQVVDSDEILVMREQGGERPDA
jgi:2-oxoglutarate ferredoxin oxidoreductase subunit beta